MVLNFLKIPKLGDRLSADVIRRTKEASATNRAKFSNEESSESFNLVYQ